LHYHYGLELEANKSLPILENKAKNEKTPQTLTILFALAHLRNEANILLNDLLFSLFVLDLAYQGTQVKCAAFHFVSTQINRLTTFV
jgi:hypothetical protein